MKVADFQKLPEMAPRPKEAYVGDRYLQGAKMIEQKMTKRPGDEISYYVVTDVTTGGYLTQPRYERLEE